MTIVKNIVELFEKEGIMPVTKDTWNLYHFDHTMPNDEKHQKGQYKFIKEQVHDKSGIYIYEKNDEIIYIGKAKTLFNRLKSHYIESFKEIEHDKLPKDTRWDRFFSSYGGEVKIYWKEFETEDERQIVEMILTKLLKPKFLTFK